MPSLGADMEAGTLVAWRRAVGDALARGDVYAEVETDKGVLGVETFEAGVLDALLVPLGARVPVGTPIARLRSGAETVRSPSSNLPDLPSSNVGSAPTPDGREPSPPVAPAAGEDPPAQRMRRAIAAAMERSHREIPHYWVGSTLDVSTASAWLLARNAQRSVRDRVLLAALFVRATARALRRVPALHGSWRDGRFVPSESVDVGLVLALRGGGLVMAAIPEADRLDVDATMRALSDVVTRARSAGLRASELTRSTVTLTNLGDRGAERVLPRIAPGHAAAVGVGRVVRRPWALDDAVVVRPVIDVTVAGDHRASDGHEGARLLDAIAAGLLPEEAP
jgi:pyruvate dehydrogenase E2 component (dihydrolipoamide acetyltransferase)